MIEDPLKKVPWVIFRVNEQLFGVPSSYVQEMVRLSDVTAMPNMPSEVRGVINLRGSVTPLLDLRTMLDMQSAKVEMDKLLENLKQREQDHKNWLKKLETCVAEKTHFTGELDPHKCAFGKWYDTFQTNDLILKGLLKRLDRPHKHIHSIGSTINSLVASDKFTEANAIIQATHNAELAEMVTLFSIVREALTESVREIAVLLYDGEKTMAMAVDYIESVERLDENSFLPPPMQNMSSDQGLISAVARRIKDDGYIMLLDVHRILYGRN